MLDFLPGVLFEVELEDVVGPLAKCETSEYDHVVVHEDARVLIPGLRQV